MNSDESHNKNDLRIIRKDKGISIEEIASRLKLTVTTIKKIESSKFDDLGAYIYVRGYINQYTAILGIEADKYLDLIPKEKMQIPLVNTRAANTRTIKFRRQSKNFASYALGTFIVVAIGFSGYFLLKNYQGVNKHTTNAIDIVESNILEIDPQEQTRIGENPEQSNETNQFHLSSMIPTTQNTDELENSEKQGQLNDLQVEKDKDIQENSAVNNDNSLDVKYDIFISANETSWIKVEHLDGTKLHNDILQPGKLEISSNKPIHFRIGNKSSVSVSINGENIDLSKYSKKDIADFNWPLDS